MNTRSDLPDPKDGNDFGPPEKVLEDLVASYVDRLTEGEKLRRDQILAEEPELGLEIMEHLEAFVDLGLPGEGNAPLGTLGDYTLRRQIGRGGMGVVYEAWENSMDRAVALKVLPAGVSADNKAFMRFMREAKTAGQLNHENVVRVHSTGVNEGTPWYSMEYVEGETLAQVVGRVKDAEPETETVFGRKDCASYFENIAKAFADVADGLQHAHSKGVIHRDIKPSNLILDQEGRLRILDFGLARLEGQESLTVSGDFVGTPLYMSPEQARRKKIPLDHRTDIYSLGASMYQALTGQPPFQGKDHHDTLSQIIERDPRPPRQYVQRIPGDLETIVLKCLRKDPGDRYGTAEALGQDLRRFVRGDPIEARPQGRWEHAALRLWRWRRCLAVSCILAVLAVVSVVLFVKVSTERQLDAEAKYDEIVLSATQSISSIQGNNPFSLRRGRTSDMLVESPFRARDAEGKRRLESALSRLEEAVSLLPYRPHARLLLGRCHWLLGQHELALRELESLLDDRPGSLRGRTLRASIFFSQGRHDQATAELRAAASAALTKGERAWVEAKMAEITARWHDAEQAYGQVLQSNDSTFQDKSSLFRLRVGRGFARLRADNIAGAIRDLQAARLLGPESLIAPLLLGQAYLLQGNLEDADRYFEETYRDVQEAETFALEAYKLLCHFDAQEQVSKWLQRVPYTSRRESARIIQLIWGAQSRKAMRVAEDAHEKFPEDAELCALLVWSYSVGGGDMERASTLEARALELDDGSVHVLMALAMAAHDAKKRLGYANRAVEIDPSFSDEALEVKVYAFLSLGEWDKAASISHSLVQRYPTDSLFHKLHGVALMRQGRVEDARFHLERAIEFNPSIRGPYAYLGDLYAGIGELDHAAKWYRRCLELCPLHRSALCHLADVLDLKGERDEALQLRCRALAQVTDHARLSAEHACLAASLRWDLRLRELGPLDNFIQETARVCKLTSLPAYFQENLSLAYLLAPRSKNVARALEHAQLAVDKSNRRNAGMLATLAAVEKARGNGTDAIRLLEEAVLLRDATMRHLEQLEAYREEELPATVSCSSVEWLMNKVTEVGPESVESLTLLIAARERLPDSSVERRYLEGCLLLADGQHERAAEVFAALYETQPSSLCARRLAEALWITGQAGDAEALLGEAIAQARGEGRMLWEVWWDWTMQKPRTEWRESLSAVPAQLQATGNGGAARVQEFEWLLEKLLHNEPLRINCGGEDYLGASGLRWSRDRFFLGGTPSPQASTEIVGSEDASLYQSGRSFDVGGLASGYRIPLPPGAYSLVLHFAEVSPWRPGPRSFDVVVEGKEVLKDFCPYDPEGNRVGVVCDFHFPVVVSDQYLDIVLRSRLGHPNICAIAVSHAED